MENYFAEYLEYLEKVKNYKKSTLETRKSSLKLLAAFLLGKDFCPKTLEDYLQEIKESHSPSYYNLQCGTFRSLIQYLLKEKLVSSEFESFHPSELTLRRKQKALLTIEEIEAILTLPIRKEYERVDHFWQLFFKLLAVCGARCGEIAKLEIGNINLAARTLLFEDTKNGDDRLVPFPEEVLPELKEWLGRRKEEGATLNSLVFKQCSSVGGYTTNEPVNHKVVTMNLKRRAKRAGLELDNRFHAHALRHSFATEVLRKNISAIKVSKILGHRNLGTVQVYTHFLVQDIREVQDRHPLVEAHADPKTVLKNLKEEFLAKQLHTNPLFDVSIKESSTRLSLDVRVV